MFANEAARRALFRHAGARWLASKAAGLARLGTRTSENAVAVLWTQPYGAAPSTGSVGDSYDNALAENLWSTLKIELIYWPGAVFDTRAEAEAVIFRYIDGWYNPRRIQKGLGGLSPDEHEEAWHTQQDQHAQS